METRNITRSLPEDTLREAEIVAARRKMLAAALSEIESHERVGVSFWTP